MSQPAAIIEGVEADQSKESTMTKYGPLTARSAQTIGDPGSGVGRRMLAVFAELEGLRAELAASDGEGIRDAGEESAHGRSLAGLSEELIGAAENGPWVRIADPTLRAFVGRYVADVAYNVADVAGLDEARQATLKLRGEGSLPTKVVES